MNRIDTLIKKFCPNGVEYYQLSEISISLNGMSNVKNKWAENGNCQFIDYMNAYSNLKIDVNNLPYATVKKISGQTVLKKGDILFTGASETIHECALSSVIEDDIIDGILLDDHLFGIRLKEEFSNRYSIRYLKHYFRSKSFRRKVDKTVKGVTRFYVGKQEFMNIKIPLPPLEVQSIIADSLDKFGDLELDLNKELVLRKNQYEYWHRKLYEKKGDTKITDVFERLKGTPITAGKMKEIESIDGDIRIFAGGQTVVNAYEEDIEKANITTCPCVIVQSRGLIDFIYYEKPCTFKNEMWAYTCNNKITVKYLYYYLKNNVSYFRTIGSQMGSMPQISLPVTEDFMIYLPDLSEQEKIVSILDKFDELVNDNDFGLPAEIEKRKKQYEFYRDRLMIFKELKA